MPAPVARAKQTIPDVTTMELAGCAHVIPLDAPQAATDAIRTLARRDEASEVD